MNLPVSFVAPALRKPKRPDPLVGLLRRDELILVEHESLVPDLVVGVEEGPDVLEQILLLADGIGNRIVDALRDAGNVLRGDGGVAGAEVLQDPVDGGLNGRVQRLMAGFRAVVGDVVLLHEYDDNAEEARQILLPEQGLDGWCDRDRNHRIVEQP